jgi:hypothetical protein
MLLAGMRNLHLHFHYRCRGHTRRDARTVTTQTNAVAPLHKTCPAIADPNHSISMLRCLLSSCPELWVVATAASCRSWSKCCWEDDGSGDDDDDDDDDDDGQCKVMTMMISDVPGKCEVEGKVK